MILPIVAYGDPILKKSAQPVSKDYPNLKSLLQNMFETMYNAYGVGLAAPQIGLTIRLFVVDASAFAEDEDLSKEEQNTLKNFKKVFINPQITHEEGDAWLFNEGCLSIPDVREDVSRKPTITLTYQDEHFNSYTETYTGLIARVIQHEYDHIEGVLFTDKLSALKRRLIKGKLNNISQGKIKVDYPMKFPKEKKKRL